MRPAATMPAVTPVTSAIWLIWWLVPLLEPEPDDRRAVRVVLMGYRHYGRIIVGQHRCIAEIRLPGHQESIWARPFDSMREARRSVTGVLREVAYRTIWAN